MILGIGTDIVHIQRIKEILEGSGKNAFLSKTFTEKEMALAEAYPDPFFFFAGRFAGKESVFKCFREQWMPGDRLTDIEITRGEAGEPIVLLHGRFGEIVRRSNAEVFLSLSHEKDCALAFAILSDEA